MLSKAIRTATVLLATLAVPAVVLAAPLPASAVNSGSLCEANGPQFCLNTANFNPYTPVTESGSGARTINAVPSGSNYLLKFNGDTSKCVAGTNNHLAVVVKVCNGSDGVLWTRETSNGSDMWVNNAASSGRGEFVYLSGLGSAGSQYALSAATTGSGLLQRFKFR
jgi:hypothetical protein